MRTTVFYNRDEIREKGDKNDIDNGYNFMDGCCWSPSSEDISYIQKAFGLVVDILKVVESKAKRPPVRLLENETFTIYLTSNTKPLKI